MIKATRVLGLSAPTLSSEATNKNYVDNIINTNYSRTEVNSATYDVVSSDNIISVLYTMTGEVDINLPKIMSDSQYTIVDEGGNASVNNIRVNANVLDTIIGESTFTITSDYNAITIYNNGSNGWFIR